MSLFNLPKGPEDLSGGIAGMYYEKIEAVSAVPRTTDQFKNRRMTFQFTPAADTWWIPSRSFFRIRVKTSLTQKPGVQNSLQHYGQDGAALPGLQTTNIPDQVLGETFAMGIENFNNITPALGFGDQMFQAAQFQIGGTTVCNVESHYQQIALMRKRLSMSQPMLQQDTGLYQSNAQQRLAAYRGQAHDIESVREATNSAIIIRYLNYVQAGQPLPNVQPASESSDYQFMYQPPLPIFDVDHAMPASKYTFHLQGNPTMDTDMYTDQSDVTFEGVGSNNLMGYYNRIEFATDVFDAKASDIEMVFYACMARGPDGSDVKFALNLQPLTALTEVIPTSTSGDLQLNFETHPDTTALIFGIQGQDESEGKGNGRSSLIASIDPFFHSRGAADGHNLTRWYVQYDGRLYPPEQNEDKFEENIHFLTQRYTDTVTQTGLIYESGGCESFHQWWLEYGPYYYMNWPRTMSTATRVQIFLSLQRAFSLNTGNPIARNLVLFTKKQESWLIRTSDARVRRVEGNE